MTGCARATLVRGDAPINLLETKEGTDRVEAILGRIQHGVCSCRGKVNLEAGSGPRDLS
nr:antitoxin Xre/MbcA/ParS toxin-binding domain-containing protein [Thioalkalivibrio sp. ALJ1]